jgi:nucleoside-diphosphate-sugar epimerase
MGRALVVGAGAVGTATALELVGAGGEVIMVTRSGSGPERSGITRVAADASDPEAMVDLAGGTDAVYNCANPSYHRWPTEWPPIAAALLAAATRSGAVLVTMSNCYGYGPVDHPMVEDDPLAATGTKGRVRAAMWADALAAHRDGRVRVTEARASDFFGPGVVGTSHFGRNMAKLLDGRRVSVVGDPDAPHSWTYVPDVARTLVHLGHDERAWGRAWHVPTAPPVGQRELATEFCALAGRPAPRVSGVSPLALRVAGLFSLQLRELRETEYQFDRPFVLDSSAATRAFGLEATPRPAALSATLDWARTPAAVGA